MTLVCYHLLPQQFIFISEKFMDFDLDQNLEIGNPYRINFGEWNRCTSVHGKSLTALLYESCRLVSDIMSMKRMMEKLGQAKTHLEIQKMIKEVDTTGSETISYHEFVLMMLGGKSTILKLYVVGLLIDKKYLSTVRCRCIF